MLWRLMKVLLTADWGKEGRLHRSGSLNQFLMDASKGSAGQKPRKNLWAKETACIKGHEDMTVQSMLRNRGMLLEAQCVCVRDERGRKGG